MGYDAVPQSADNIPLGVVHVPDVGLRVMQGANAQTDNSGNDYASITLARASKTLLSATAGTVWSGAGTVDSADVDVSGYTEMALDVNLTANSGTSPTIQFIVLRKGADGVYYPIYSSSVINTQPTVLSRSIGPGLETTVSLGSTIRLRRVIGGTTPTWTGSYSLIAK